MQRYFSNKKEKDIIYINEEDIHHLKNVMRKKENDEFPKMKQNLINIHVFALYLW